jgi:hypothetical protein
MIARLQDTRKPLMPDAKGSPESATSMTAQP